MINPDTIIEPLDDGAIIHLYRKGVHVKNLRLGPNHVHAFVTHPDGSIEDCGISQNLLTNAGRDLWAAAFGHATHKTSVTTSASTATTMTDSGGAFNTPTTNQYVGWRVYQPITGITTAPVYGNIGSQTATVLTVDQWWTPTDGTGGNPASGNSYVIWPACVPRFMAMSATAGTSASHTALAGEESGGVGLNRSKATYAHTAATATYTMQVIYTLTGTPTGNPQVNMGLFTASTLTAAGILVFETALNQSATVGNGDTLTVTDTITLSG